MIGLYARVCGALLILLAVAGALYGSYRHGVTVTDLAWQAKWSKQVSDQSVAVATTATEYRTEEQRRQKAANQVANNARQEQTVAVVDGVADDASGDGLRVKSEKLAATTGCTASDTGSSQRSKAATSAAMVLSDLLSRADARARELAKYADSARIAGKACEAAYRSLSGSAR